MLEPGFISVLESRSRDDFQNQVVAFTRRLGFETVSAMVVLDHLAGESEFITVDNTPAGYKDAFNNRTNGPRDPVMQHCRRNSLPIVWDQSSYTAAGQADKWEEQACFGYRHGIAVAIHLPEGRHFFLGVDRDRPVPRGSVEATRLIAYLQLFAVHAQDAALRIFAPRPAETTRLTPRELEVLRWTMEGKTAWEVGNVLGISERTAALHAIHATHKLRCANKLQAVLKALRLGLLH